jgi:hypothetical protein
VTRRRVVLVSATGGRRSSALAAAVAVEAAAGFEGAESAALLCEIEKEPRRRPATMLAAPGARRLESALRAGGLAASARGHLCQLGLEDDDGALENLSVAAAEADLVVAAIPASLWTPALEWEPLGVTGGLLLADLPRERPLAALAVAELRKRGRAAQVTAEAPRGLAGRRALAGVRPGGPMSERLARIAAALCEPRGQALPMVLAACAVILLCALALTAIGGAMTGASRAQRAADLAALSAARSMRDDMPRLLAPALLPDGSPNPRHLARGRYLGRARLAAEQAARNNGLDPGRLRVSFPDARSTPPLRARATVTASVDPAELPGGERLADGGGLTEPIDVVASATAEGGPPSGSYTGMPAEASGGGYSGPLVYRNGEGMRPDVGAAYDRMAAAARGEGHLLTVTSGFRSDAEQARLWEAHPDPRWVAPPGRSLHRCATELDIGPSSAYGWLAANARRFGFLQRYSWEAWHYGFVAGPAPCSAAGESGGLSGSASGAGPDGGRSAAGLPEFVPARYREPILRSAGRWNVSPALLAAQLMAESGFDPHAVSPAGASGIAQFMPGTAASYGLRDPFDPVAAIDAQAHLMSDLLRQFRSIPLALAAYNAGPGAVAPCSCIPPYPETRAYVARILALLDGAGAILAPPLEVRLVD